jgi:hypothetical protein
MAQIKEFRFGVFEGSHRLAVEVEVASEADGIAWLGRIHALVAAGSTIDTALHAAPLDPQVVQAKLPQLSLVDTGTQAHAATERETPAVTAAPKPAPRARKAAAPVAPVAGAAAPVETTVVPPKAAVASPAAGSAQPVESPSVVASSPTPAAVAPTPVDAAADTTLDVPPMPQQLAGMRSFREILSFFLANGVTDAGAIETLCRAYAPNVPVLQKMVQPTDDPEAQLGARIKRGLQVLAPK